jgi:hypothetical protein
VTTKDAQVRATEELAGFKVPMRVDHSIFQQTGLAEEGHMREWWEGEKIQTFLEGLSHTLSWSGLQFYLLHL